MKAIKIEQTVFALDRALYHGNTAADWLGELAVTLRSFLPSGPASDLAKPIDDLARTIRVLLASSGPHIRESIMEYGLPSDDVACDACGSPDFTNAECKACAAVRSDGLQLARRLSGWRI